MCYFLYEKKNDIRPKQFSKGGLNGMNLNFSVPNGL